jgi:activator of HSP90 ATPase
MGKNEFKLSAIFPATPEQLFDGWLSSTGHAAFTGSPAKVEDGIGGAFSAWDGYIWGRTLERERPHRIVQAWRTSEFPEDSPDSRVEIVLEKIKEGVRLTLKHMNIPEGQATGYKQGWEDFYFKPMREYFER